jgi:hypothetical protein
MLHRWPIECLFFFFLLLFLLGTPGGYRKGLTCGYRKGPTCGYRKVPPDTLQGVPLRTPLRIKAINDLQLINNYL